MRGVPKVLIVTTAAVVARKARDVLFSGGTNVIDFVLVLSCLLAVVCIAVVGRVTSLRVTGGIILRVALAVGCGRTVVKGAMVFIRRHRLVSKPYIFENSFLTFLKIYF